MSEFDDLVHIMKVLRSSEGCTWDREQTYETLIPYLLEETYEVIESIDSKNLTKLKEELGDLLLQIVFQAQIASETRQFEIRDVIHGIIAKLKNRHPHIFDEKKLLTPEQVTANWEKIKLAEKENSGDSVLSGMPKSMPALLRAFRLQQKAARFGFDWEKWQDVYEKTAEEMSELKAAVDSGEQDKTEEELGDLLFAVVNLARFLKVDPETALNRMNRKFIDRFHYVEQKLAERGKNLGDSNLAEMDSLWNEAKHRLP